MARTRGINSPQWLHTSQILNLSLSPHCMCAAPAEVQSHALAFLMLVATQDGRHAAVVTRAGAVPAILKLLDGILQGPSGPGLAEREGGHRQQEGSNTAEGRAVDFAAAVLASLCRHRDIQVFGQTEGGMWPSVHLPATGIKQLASLHAWR